MASLLDKSLGDIVRQNGGRPAVKPRTSGGASRSSPYAKSDEKSDVEQPWKHDMYDSPSGGGPRRGGSEGKTSRVLTILNLHYEVSERELEALFAQIGPLDGSPKIKFDRSGRSEGEATVRYEKVPDAVSARTQFNGANAKGQPIDVRYDMRFAEGGSKDTSSLLNRVQGAVPLARKMAADSPRLGLPYNKGDATDVRPSRPTVRPVRGVGVGVGARGGIVGRGGVAARGRGAGPVRGVGGRVPEKKPKTASELDKELEDFMNAPAPIDKAAAATLQAATAIPLPTEDVDMI